MTILSLVILAAALYLAWALQLWLRDRADARTARDVVLRKWSAYRASKTAYRLAKLGRVPARVRGAVAGAFRLRTVAGRLAACLMLARGWWAEQLFGWESLIADKPTFARTFPLLAKWTAFCRAQFTVRALATIAVILCASFATASAVFAMGPIRHLRSHSQIPSLDMMTTGAVAGNRQYQDLEQMRALRYVQVRVSLTYDIATANGVAVRNLGLAEALFSEIGITGGGDGDIIRADPLALNFSSEYMLANSAVPKTRITSPNIGTSNISSVFRLWLENPQSVNPRETILLQKESSARLQLFATRKTVTTGAGTSSAGSGALLQGAGGTVATITAAQIRIQQINNNALTQLPYFRPRVSQVNFPIAATGSDVQCVIPLESGEYLRGLTIMFVDANEMISVDSGTGAANFVLQGDVFTYLGSGIKLLTQDYALGQAFETGGETTALWQQRLFHYNMQAEGRLSNIYNPGQDTNLRFVLNVVTVPTGFTLVVVKHSLLRDKTITSDGRRVVTETLPEELAEPIRAAA